MPHQMFCFNHVNKINVVDDLCYESGYTIECNGYLGCNSTKLLPVLSRWSCIGSSFWKVVGIITTYCCFGYFSIIDSSDEYNSAYLCTCVLYIFMLYLVCITKPLLSGATSYDIFLAASWSDYKDESVSLGFATRNDELPYNLLAYISNYFSVSKLNFMLMFLFLFLYIQFQWMIWPNIVFRLI